MFERLPDKDPSYSDNYVLDITNYIPIGCLRICKNDVTLSSTLVRIGVLLPLLSSDSPQRPNPVVHSVCLDLHPSVSSLHR